MKNFIKKIIAIASMLSVITTMSIGMVSASAEEISENANSPYDIAPGLNLTDDDVAEIIAKTAEMARAEGMSEEEIEELTSIWYSNDNSEISTFSADSNSSAKQFFTVVSVNAGYQVNDDLEIWLEYGRTSDAKPISVISSQIYNNDALYLPNATTFLTPSKVMINNYVHRYAYTISNIPKQTTKEGNIVKFNLNVANNLTGLEAYELIANNSCITFPYEDISTMVCKIPNVYYSNYICNYNVGALGDIFYDNNGAGYINDYDSQYLASYICKLETITPVQFAAADVDSNGVVNVLDLGQLKKYIDGGITEF